MKSYHQFAHTQIFLKSRLSAGIPQTFYVIETTKNHVTGMFELYIKKLVRLLKISKETRMSRTTYVTANRVIDTKILI